MVRFSSPVGPGVRPTKIRSRLVLMIIGTLIPILAFSGFMLVAFNRQTREATERGLVETARALSVAVDQHVGASMSVLLALATSEHLQEGDLRGFDRAASWPASRPGTSRCRLSEMVRRPTLASTPKS